MVAIPIFSEVLLKDFPSAGTCRCHHRCGAFSSFIFFPIHDSYTTEFCAKIQATQAMINKVFRRWKGKKKPVAAAVHLTGSCKAQRGLLSNGPVMSMVKHFGPVFWRLLNNCFCRLQDATQSHNNIRARSFVIVLILCILLQHILALLLCVYHYY